VIQQQMQLHALWCGESCPIETLAHRSITVASMLISLCLKRNWCRPQIAARPNPGIGSEVAGIALRITARTVLVCVGQGERAGACGNPKCRSFPHWPPAAQSRAGLSPQLAEQHGHELPQLLKPRACRSALCYGQLCQTVRETSLTSARKYCILCSRLSPPLNA